MTIFHFCQSVEGALRNWDKRTWKHTAKTNNMTVEECQDEFWKMLREGKQKIPIGKMCEGFSYQKGCPGHNDDYEDVQEGKKQ